jgi:hypothetical protein
VNSEEIKNRFGSYRVKVLQQDQVHRVASLYSEHNDKAVCRTLAVTYFWQPTPTVVIPADTRIRQGHSIGSTLLDAGLILHRQSLLEATALSGSGFEALSAGTVCQGTPVLLRLYRLDVGAEHSALQAYATIAEAHHPEHNPPHPSLPDISLKCDQNWGDLATAALSTLLTNLQ